MEEKKYWEYSEKELIEYANEKYGDDKVITRLANLYKDEITPNDSEDGDDELMAQKMEDYINGHDYNANFEKFSYYMRNRCHRTLQQGFFRLIMTHIMNVAKMSKYMIDDRNKASWELAKEIKRLLEENDINTGLPLI